ncbi:protein DETOXIFICATION 16-like [Humulus lupulus]|uniref:protein DETOXIFICATION 16-like n=1 Tax=Humulus lupulus TaxID=3486 RepID=UPI002B412858|nr:protein DETOXIFICATION 16-like [Humulus lupulus]
MEKVFKEVGKQLVLAGPVSLVTLSQISLQMISLMFIGHNDGELALAGASMATAFAAATGYYVLVGATSALDTLCGQLFGAKLYLTLGIQLQRAVIFSSTCSILISIIWANATPILISMHQDHQISQEAGRYLLLLIPSSFAFGFLQCFRSFLQNQNIVYPMVLSSLVATPIHIFCCWILVSKSGLGSSGAALATSVSYWVNALCLALFIKFSSSCKRTWNGFSKQALRNFLPYVKLAMPSVLMECFKTWAFELLIIFSGFLPNPMLETSVQSICLNTFGLLWSIPAGLMASTSVRVGNELGAKNLQAAHFAIGMVLVMVIMEGLVVGVIVVLLRKMWAGLYSNDKNVTSIVASLMPFIAMSCFVNGFETVLSGIFRGCGWQKKGVYLNLAAFYFVGVPCQVTFAFVLHMKAKGLWLGMIVAFVVDIVFFLIIIIRTNWDKEVAKAENRVKKYSNFGELALDQNVSSN